MSNIIVLSDNYDIIKIILPSSKLHHNCSGHIIRQYISNKCDSNFVEIVRHKNAFEVFHIPISLLNDIVFINLKRKRNNSRNAFISINRHKLQCAFYKDNLDQLLHLGYSHFISFRTGIILGLSLFSDNNQKINYKVFFDLTFSKYYFKLTH